MLGGALAFGQGTTYFNRVHLPGDNNANIIVSDTGYVVLQQGNPQVNDLHYHYYNKQGFYQVTDTLELDTFYENCRNCLVKWKGGYLKLATYYFDNQRGESLLLELDRSLDTLSSKKLSYNDPLNFTTASNGLKVFGPNEILATGYFFNSAGNFSLWVSRLDSNLNVVWDSIYNRSGWTGYGGWQGHDAVKLADGGYLIGGIASRFLNQPNAGVLLKIDSLGAEQWRKELTGPEGNNEVLLHKLSDSTVAFLTVQRQEHVSTKFYWTRLRYGKIDLYGNILEDTLIGPRLVNINTAFFKDAGANTFLTGGFVLMPDWGSYAFKFSLTGDSIWYRNYFYGADRARDEAQIETMAFTPDGGMIFCGYFIDKDGLGAHTWLVKTDSLGCDTPGCNSIGLREYSSAKPVFSLYPNPVQDATVLQWEPGLSQGFTLTLSNSQGQILRKYEIDDYQANQKVLDLGDLPKGVYWLKLVYANGRQQQISLLKQ